MQRGLLILAFFVLFLIVSGAVNYIPALFMLHIRLMKFVELKTGLHNHSLSWLELRTFRRGCLTHAQQSFYACIVHTVNQTEVGEVTFLLFGFLGQDVAFESVLSLNFS